MAGEPEYPEDALIAAVKAAIRRVEAIVNPPDREDGTPGKRSDRAATSAARTLPALARQLLELEAARDARKPPVDRLDMRWVALYSLKPQAPLCDEDRRWLEEFSARQQAQREAQRARDEADHRRRAEELREIAAKIPLHPWEERS